MMCVMARTAPAPNIPPIPGMCPSLAVLAGGGDGGGGSGGDAGDGSGDDNAAANKGGENAEADKRGAPDPEKYPECGTASHPVDVVTGRAFTHPIVDLALPGPLRLSFARTYSSKAAGVDMGLGLGWAHTFGWKVEVQRRRITVWNEQGTAVDFPVVRPGDEVVGPWGWVLRREAWGFAVDADDGVWHMFSEVDPRDGAFYLLTAIEDRNRNRISLTYDDGRLVEAKDSTGRMIRLTPTRDRRIASIMVQDAGSGRWVTFATYAYDERGDLASATDADGYTSRYEYDEDHRLTLDQDRTGLAFHFVYDRQGRCVEAWGDYPGKRDPSLADDVPRYLTDGTTRAKGIHHCKFEWGDGGYSEVVDSREVRRFFGNKHGTLSKSVEGGGVMTAVYRDDGHILSRTDALGGVISFDRDVRGRLLKVTDALGRSTTFENDALGLPVTIADAAGGITTMVRDAFGNVTVMTDPSGAVSSYRYDTRGLLTEAVWPNGSKTTCEYDAAGNAVTIVEPDGGVRRATYDGFGRPLTETDPLGNVTRFAYSTRGDVLEEQEPDGALTRYAYDGEGHVTRIASAAGTVEVTWGGYEKLCERKDVNGNVTRIRYDLEGQPVAVENEVGAAHRIEYDGTGNVSSETTFDGRTVRYRYDLIGRLVRIESGAGKTRLGYDAAGQLVERELPDGVTETFAYDALGNVIAAANAAVEIRLERDVRGDVIREIQAVRGEEHIVEATHDEAGARLSVRTSLGHLEAITRDAAGRRARTVLGEAYEILHRTDALGREIACQLPGGARIESAYDPVARLLRRVVAAGAPPSPTRAGEPEWLGARATGVVVECAYQYDAAGELASTRDSRRGSTELRHDAAGNLLARLPQGGPEEVFSFDPAGNLHEAGAGAPSRAYTRGNRLLRRGATDYRWHDESGQLAEKQDDGAAAWKYAWNGAGLLEKVTTPDGAEVRFLYDPFARRMEKRVSRPKAPGGPVALVSKTRFVWDGDTLVHEITTSANGAVMERTYAFVDGEFDPFSHRDVRRGPGGVEEGRWFHYVNDQVGKPDRLIDASGQIACEIVTTAWGRTTTGPAPATTTPLRFAGQYEDQETGLFYNRFRYYDPVDGRYLSPDPLGIDAELNAFSFVPSPFSWVDPLGLEWNYRLVNSSGKVYYHGKAGDDVPPHKVMQRHRTKPDGKPRMGMNDRMEQISPRGTAKDTVRGVEQEGKKVTKKCATNPRGNKINAAGPRNSGTPKRIKDGRSFITRNSTDGTVTGLPTRITHDPNDPGATTAAWRAKK